MSERPKFVVSGFVEEAFTEEMFPIGPGRGVPVYKCRGCSARFLASSREQVPPHECGGFRGYP